MEEAPSNTGSSTLESIVTQPVLPVPPPVPPSSSQAGPPHDPPPIDPSDPVFDGVRSLIGARGARASSRTEEILRAMAAALAQQRGQQPPPASHTVTTTILPPPRPPSPPLVPPQPLDGNGNNGGDDDARNDNANEPIDRGASPGDNNNSNNLLDGEGCGVFFNLDRDTEEFDELLVPALVRHRHENRQIWPFWLVSIDGQRALRAMQKATTDLSLLSDKNTSLPPGVVPDSDLTYSQFRDGVQFFINLLHFSDRKVWKEELQEAWVAFYADLDTHPVKRTHLGERAIVIYANHVRMRFYTEMSALSPTLGLTPLKVSGARLREIRLSLEIEETQKVSPL